MKTNKHTARIMIVEDENIIAEDMKITLQCYGYEIVAIANSGEKAIIEAENRKPELILMDIMLNGELDGIETANKIKKKLGIQVIYLTAYSNDSTIMKASRTEPLGYLLKPFDERELHATIQMALYKIRKKDNSS